LRAKGYDLHLILIAAASPDGPCVPATLGSGSCPADENLPGYRHVVSSVASRECIDARDQRIPAVLVVAASWFPPRDPGVSDDDSDV
jgi:hypothetical protein